ncbi:MAG TPA: Wadjet anti-phage system protein JetA family protein [Bacilli bacterium]|nr:Wadjet anti-phage system protein JetA family protein [Bacilli bacterium]
MSLFTILPSNFFSILASKNKEIYAEALLLLQKSLESNDLLIRRSDFVRTLKDKYSDLILQVDLSEDENEDAEQRDFSDKASFVVRRLEETGWIDVEISQENFEEYIALPSYSISFLTLLNDLVTDHNAEYVSLVHATYSELKQEDEARDEFMYATLVRAFENTKKLRTELITLAHSIRIFQNRLGKVFSTNNILEDYFDLYKTRVSDRYYHPLKTFDSVAKFKRPILSILQNWLYSEEIRKQLTTQALMWTRAKDAQAAEQDIISKINFISDMYEQLGSTISEIDRKHQDYTKASANKILYLNRADKTIKGHLDYIFKVYAEKLSKGDTVSPILNTLRDTFTMVPQGFITPEAITIPIVRKLRDESLPLSISEFELADDVLIESFIEEARNQFSTDRVLDFMDLAFDDDSELHISEISLPNFEAFMLLILATIESGSDECFYTVEREEGSVSNYGYRMPSLRFIRKEVEA